MSKTMETLLDPKRIAVIPDDGTVIHNRVGLSNLDLSNCGLPKNLHALQWNGSSGIGEVEFTDKDNEQLWEFPDWALAAIEVHAKELDSLLNPKPFDNEDILNNVHMQRITFLKETDWTGLPDSPLSESQKEAWRIYRNEIRNLPSKQGYPFNGIYNYENWPKPPTPNVINEPGETNMHKNDPRKIEDLWLT